MATALWRRGNNVDKQEMDALLDIAMSFSDTETAPKSPAKDRTRSSRKRSRQEDDKVEEQGVDMTVNM